MNDKDVNKAIKICGTPMTHHKFWSKAKLTEAARKAKEKACVHFLTNVPNSKEGWAFINQMKKYLHKGRYSIRLKGRGSRKEHGNQSFLPIPHAEHYSIYIDHKIMDGRNPAFYALNEYKIRQKLRNLRSEIDELLK
tara:strand:- start:1495 stop:1905 length:411 start_codon:yes stop_codon:yes gene_type:complete